MALNSSGVKFGTSLDTASMKRKVIGLLSAAGGGIRVSDGLDSCEISLYFASLLSRQYDSPKAERMDSRTLVAWVC
jgi:hypothetical protein